MDIIYDKDNIGEPEHNDIGLDAEQWTNIHEGIHTFLQYIVRYANKILLKDEIHIPIDEVKLGTHLEFIPQNLKLLLNIDF